MPLPFPAITKIPNTEPAAVPDLWNATYQQVDANFVSVDDRLGIVENSIAEGYALSAGSLSTARVLTVGATGKTFDGTANVSWSLAEIGAAAASHSHAIANVTGLQVALDGKLASGGVAASATQLASARTFAIGGVGKTFDGTANVSWSLAEIGAAAASHSHAIANVTGLQAALDGKANAGQSFTLDSLSGVTITSNTNGEILRWTGTAWVNNTLAEAGIAAVSHTHTVGNVTGLQGELDGKAAASHTHTTGNITGLDAALAGKSATSHGHAISSISGLQGELDARATKSYVDSAIATALASYLTKNNPTFTGTMTGPAFNKS